MNVNGANNSHTPAIPQKSDVKTQTSAQSKNAAAMPRDKYERSQTAEQYSTYSSSGATAAQPSAAQATASSGATTAQQAAHGQILYIHNPEGTHPLMRIENRINSQTVTMHSNATGGEIVFRMLRDGTMWISENGGQRPEDFTQIDPTRGVPGIPQTAVWEVYYTMRLNQNMPIIRNANGVHGDMRQLVDSFVALRDEIGGEQHRRFIENAFRNLANNVFSFNGALDIGDRANNFADVFLANFRTHGVEEAFDQAWAAANQTEGSPQDDKPWLTDLSSQEFGTMRRFSRELLHTSGTSRKANHSLEVSLQLLVNAFKPMHEHIGDDFDSNRQLFEAGFSSAVRSAFLWESERTIRRDTWLDTEEGRVRNWDALNYNTKVMDGNAERGRQFSALFFENLDALGIQGAFEAAMSAMGLNVPESVPEVEEPLLRPGAQWHFLPQPEAPAQPTAAQNTVAAPQTATAQPSAAQATASSGATAAPQAAQSTATESNAPDITAWHHWQDPRIEEKNALIRQVYLRRAQESINSGFYSSHAWARYFDPRASHFVGGDMCDSERRMAHMQEVRAIMYLQGRAALPPGNWFTDPIFEGRGLGNGDPNVPRRNADDLNAHRVDATWKFQQRNNITRQLRALFSSNGVFIPENTRLRFIIDSDFNLRVEGTDDKDLISRIEELLNRNGNARELFIHISATRQPNSTQFTEGSHRLWQLSSAIEDYTGLNLRHDLELVNGRFITEDGTHVLDILAETDIDPHIMAWIIGELSWLADRGGAENIPEMELSIDFENGNLFCVGQENGFGPGQTGWIDKLSGTDAPGARDYA